MSYEQTQSHHRDLLEIDKAKFTLGTYTTKKKKKICLLQKQKIIAITSKSLQS